MVKTLLKYEFKARIKLLLILWGIILLVAGAVKLLSLFRVDSIIFNIFYGSAIFFLVTGCIALLAVTVVLNIVRFYKNLYSAEGYLSFTLPVSEHQHIFVKTFVSFVLLLGAGIVCCLAALIAADTETLRIFFGAIGSMFDGIIRTCGTFHFVLYVIEGVFALIAYILSSVMIFQACLSIGQLAKRKKVLLALGVYAGLYVTGQIFSTIFWVIMQISMTNGNLVQRISDWISAHPTASIHIGLCAFLLIEAVSAVVYYIATYLPMKKKLNLE